MAMETLLLIITLLVCFASAYFAYKVFADNNNAQRGGLEFKLDAFSKEIARIEASVKNEIINNRKESLQEIRSSREELSNSLKSFGELISNSMQTIGAVQKDQLAAFSNNLVELTKSVDQKIFGLTA